MPIPQTPLRGRENVGGGDAGQCVHPFAGLLKGGVDVNGAIRLAVAQDSTATGEGHQHAISGDGGAGIETFARFVGVINIDKRNTAVDGDSWREDGADFRPRAIRADQHVADEGVAVGECEFMFPFSPHSDHLCEFVPPSDDTFGGKGIKKNLAKVFAFNFRSSAIAVIGDINKHLTRRSNQAGRLTAGVDFSEKGVVKTGLFEGRLPSVRRGLRRRW